jgi:transcriptional regulator with XRE-family HTH domain
MPVASKVWDSLSWPNRIKLALETLNINQARLADLLNVTARTVTYWLRGKFVPCERVAYVLKSLCVVDTFDDIKEASFMATNSMSIDGAAKLYAMALLSGDPMLLAMATHSIAIKQATLLTTGINNDTVIIRIKSIFGETKTHLNITNAAGQSNKEVTITVDVPDKTSSIANFVLLVAFKDADVIKSKFAFTATDKAMTTIVYRVKKFLN